MHDFFFLSLFLDCFVWLLGGNLMPDKAARGSWCDNAAQQSLKLVFNREAHNVEQKLSGNVTLAWLVQIATENMRSDRKINSHNTDVSRVWANVVDVYWLVCVNFMEHV